MSGAVIWYYPGSTRATPAASLSVQEILFSEPFGALEPEPDHTAAVAESVSGVRVSQSLRNRLRVRLVIDRVTDPDLMAALHTLESHLQRGGVIAVANEVTKAWAGYLLHTPNKGDTVFRTGGNPWGSLSGSTQQIAAGDQVWVSSRSPEAFRDVGVVASAAFASVDRVTLETGMAYAPQLTPCLARHRDFYPAMVMESPGTPVVTVVADGRAVSVDVALVEHLPTLASGAKRPAGYYLRSGQGGWF